MSEQPVSDHSQVLVLEPGRAEFHYWRDLWHYRELRDPRLARCRGALQADRDWYRLGRGAAIPDDDRMMPQDLLRRISPINTLSIRKW